MKDELEVATAILRDGLLSVATPQGAFQPGIVANASL
jgi:hypothetical protein